MVKTDPVHLSFFYCSSQFPITSLPPPLVKEKPILVQERLLKIGFQKSCQISNTDTSEVKSSR